MNDKLFNKIVISLILILCTCIGALLLRNRDIKTFSLTKKLPIYAVKTDKPEVALTFDVNWAETDYLYDILDILKEKQVKATFFIMGGWVETSEENVEKLKRIYEDGHEIGNHTHMHPDMTKISRDRMIKEIELTDAIIKNHLGITTNLFRCPSGAYNDIVIETVESTGRFVIQWDVDISQIK